MVVLVEKVAGKSKRALEVVGKWAGLTIGVEGEREPRGNVTIGTSGQVFE